MTRGEPVPGRTVPTRTRLAFGIGAAAENMSLYSLSVLGLLFYNQVLGLDVLLAGLVPTIALLTDAISDPLFGSFSDRYRSKRWGRRHPFMLISPIPIALSFFCVFNPPDDLTPNQLFGWFLIWSISLRTFMTVYHVPHLAMGAELSSGYIERSRIMSYNNLFYWLGGAGLFKLNTVLFFASVAVATNGLLNRDAYPRFSMVMALFVLIVLFSSAWFTRDRIPNLPQAPEDLEGFSIRAFGRDVASALSNRNYRMLMIAVVALSLMFGLRLALTNYMNIFYWELRSEDIGTLLFTGSFIGYVTGFVFAARLHTRFDKRGTIVLTALGLSVFPAMPVVLRLMGTFPENGSPWLMWAVAGFQALSSGSGSILHISVMSALADIADENEVRIGHRQEGTLYAARTFFAKLDNSLGQGIAALSLTFIGFPKNAQPGAVDADTIYWLGLIESPLSIFPGVIAACFYAQYRINRQRYEKTRRQLEEIRARSG